MATPDSIRRTEYRYHTAYEGTREALIAAGVVPAEAFAADDERDSCGRRRRTKRSLLNGREVKITLRRDGRAYAVISLTGQEQQTRAALEAAARAIEAMPRNATQFLEAKKADIKGPLQVALARAFLPIAGWKIDPAAANEFANEIGEAVRRLLHSRVEFDPKLTQLQVGHGEDVGGLLQQARDADPAFTKFMGALMDGEAGA